MEWRLWPPGSSSEAQPWFWMSLGPGSAAVSQLLLFPLIYSAPSTLRCQDHRCPSHGLCSLVASAPQPPCTACSPRVSLCSLDPSLCVFVQKSPSESICLAGQTLGSGPCS